MKKVGFICFILLLCSYFRCAGTDSSWDLGEMDEVICYRLDPMASDSLSTFNGCAIVESVKLSALQIKDLKKIMNDPSLVSKDDSLVKFSTFIPTYAFVFVNKSDSSVLLLDFHSDQWSYVHRGTSEIRNNEPARESLLALVDDVMNGGKVKKNDVQTDDAAGVSAKCDSTETVLSVYSNVDDKSILPTEIQKALTDAVSVEWYMLDPMSEGESPADNYHGYGEILSVASSDAEQVESVKSIFLKPQSFVDTEVLKNCTFIPDMALTLKTSENEEVRILFSFYCNECLILKGSERFQSDCKLIRQEVLLMAKNLFPNDRYVRFLMRG